MRIHYFTYGDDIAAVEDGAQAEKFKAAGWQAATHDEFVAAWAKRDQANRPQPRPPVQRAVGEMTGDNKVYPAGYIH